MTVAATDWAALNALPDADLKNALFDLLQQVAVQIQESDRDDPDVLSTVPRIANLISGRAKLDSFAPVLSALARSVGLWNYIDKEHADARDRLIAEAVTSPELGDITFHREQIAALNILLEGRNLILSAPTSFGKSLLIDALLASGRYNRVAVVVPTISLLDESRRRLAARFGEEFDIVMHHSETSDREKVVFLGTQERLISRNDLGKLDLAVVDEFYKLDPDRKDDRSITLNAAVYRLLKSSKQFFFLGPNIKEVRISGDGRWRFEFLRTRFSTVAVDTYDLKDEPNREKRLIKEAYDKSNWPALVFVSSPDKANTLALTLLEAKKTVGAGAGLAAWIDQNYGGRWALSDAVAAGIGLHHGRIPRALASRFVRFFNQGKLPILICTSTLIEGVNTAAKSVLIYDKKIAREDFDFFTFSNIRGRAGRLGQHHVGKVFLFHSPPEPEEVQVASPLFGDLDDAPDELVVHLADEDLSLSNSERVEQMSKILGLSASELQRFSSLGIDKLAQLQKAVATALARRSQISWSGYPGYEEILATCDVICQTKRATDFGAATPKQLTYYLNQLRHSETMRKFFSWYASSYRGGEAQLDNIFKFLRACEYSLPEFFAAVEMFCRKAGGRCDYTLFLAELPRWFREEVLKNLEEQGVPIQISERFKKDGDTIAALSLRLREAAVSQDRSLSDFECDWILDAIPERRAGVR